VSLQPSVRIKECTQYARTRVRVLLKKFVKDLICIDILSNALSVARAHGAFSRRARARTVPVDCF
jgi:hypothetical protein